MSETLTDDQCPVLAAYGRRLNSLLPPERQIPLSLSGTLRVSREIERARCIVQQTVRVLVPIAFEEAADLLSRSDLTSRLRLPLLEHATILRTTELQIAAASATAKAIAVEIANHPAHGSVLAAAEAAGLAALSLDRIKEGEYHVREAAMHNQIARTAIEHTKIRRAARASNGIHARAGREAARRAAVDAAAAAAQAFGWETVQTAAVKIYHDVRESVAAGWR